MSLASEQSEVLIHDEEVMGTVVSFELYFSGISRDRARSTVAAACDQLHVVDGVFSTWKPESPMSRLRRGEVGIGEVPPQISEVLEICSWAVEVSSGWFDPWALPGGVDPTGLVKGWAIEQITHLLIEAGIDAGMVNAGGDLATFGRPPKSDAWRIGIQHPWKADALACVIETSDSVATSGSYERGSHLFDPHTGRLVNEPGSATVVGASLTVADCLATALAVSGEAGFEQISEVEGYGLYLILPDGREMSTSDIVFVNEI